MGAYLRPGPWQTSGRRALEQGITAGKASRIVALAVFRPISGIRQVFEDVPLDTLIKLREWSDAYTVLQVTLSFSFGLGR